MTARSGVSGFWDRVKMNKIALGSTVFNSTWMLRIRKALGAVMLSALFASPCVAVAKETKHNPAAECQTKVAYEIVPCLEKLQHSANLELVRIFNESAKQLKDMDSSASGSAIASLNESRKQFEAFRNIECQRVGDSYLGGSGSGAAQASCALELTRWYTSRIRSGSQD